jgi:signal peptidase I
VTEGSPDTEADPPREPVGSGRSTEPKKRLRLWQESVLLVAVAVVLAVVIKALFVQSFYIPSPSMEPGLVKNDRIMVQKWSYWFGGSPQRGDVVVFEDPGDWLNPADAAGPTNPVAKVMAKIGLYPEGGHLVKRVIGVEGDVITCCDKEGRISVNGTPLDEGGYARMGGGECFGPMTGDCHWSAGPVPADHIFVMGDNRSNSADSSYHLCGEHRPDCEPGDGFVPVDLVVGKVFVVLWPEGHFRWVGRPDALADVP